jgi:phosphopantothenoylcysteine decarboxylase/phosphopantothenate--cysteine ligase
MNLWVSGLRNKTLLLGVSGGIAAYKTPELVRRLRDAGADVHVVVTRAGARFVSPLALEVVSGHPVGLDLWTTDGDSKIVHTDLGRDVDLIVLAPATANLLARVRHGFADDLLSTTVMACQTPVLVCPSMNTQMLHNPLVQENLSALEVQERFSILSPHSGELACGVTGAGRLPDPDEIIGGVRAALSPQDLSGVRVTVSAGPTVEDLDPVRFLSNRSTGTMGFELARALADRGAEVTLIAGPVRLSTPVGVRRVDVRSADDMSVAIHQAWPTTHALIMSAAVADYRPAVVVDSKMKKVPGDLSLPLERTQDVLASVGARQDREGKLLVGFAAETEQVTDRAHDKLLRKGLDWIIANDVSGSQMGFGTGDNAGVLLGRAGETIELERMPKADFADAIVEHLSESLRGAP